MGVSGAIWDKVSHFVDHLTWVAISSVVGSWMDGCGVYNGIAMREIKV